MWTLIVGILGSLASVSFAETSTTIQQTAPQQPSLLAPPLYGWAPGDPGFTVQTGYEGYLVPSGTGESLAPFAHSGINPLTALSVVGTGAHLLHSLIPHPKLALKIISKIGLWFLGFFSLLLLGGVFTTAICAFTPICTISFLGFGLNRESMRSYLSTDKLSTLSMFVNEAVEKYKQLQKKPTESEKGSSS